MADRQRPQPFRYWLPFYSHRAPTTRRPPTTRQQARSPTPPAFPRASPVVGAQPHYSSQGQSPTPPTSPSASPLASPVVGAQPQDSPKEQPPTPPASQQASPVVAAQSLRQPEANQANSEDRPKYVKSPKDNVVNSSPVDSETPKPRIDTKEIEKEPETNLDAERESKPFQPPVVEEQSEQVNEEVKIYREAKQKAPDETLDPNILSEGFNKDKLKDNQEIEVPKPERSDRPTKTVETEISTTEPHTEFPSEGSKLNLELRISRPNHSEEGEKLSIEKPVIKNGSRGKETKIAISTIPRASFFDGQRACFHKEIEDGLEKLDQKQVGRISQKPGFGQAVSIITFAGENKGASMVIGGDVKLREEKMNSIYSTNPGINSSINSNVQSINNSTLQESSCSAHNPGVYLNLTSKQTKQLSQLGRKEPPKAKEMNLNVRPDTKLPPDPRIRRRCLRALFMESESDPENPQKPRRHGCRFSCDEKLKKGNEDGSSRTLNQ